MSEYADALAPELYQRLRRPPCPHSVAGSLPVLFFGDVFTAQIATIGINPSCQEYLDPNGNELDGEARRFETLASLGATSRSSLTDAQCSAALRRMRSYFVRRPTVFRWFRPLERVLAGMRHSYASGYVAHLDLVQEATQPTWSALAREHRGEAADLLASDAPFLRWQLATFPLQAVICNGMTALRHVCGMLDQPVDVENAVRGQFARLRLYATHGRIGGGPIGVVGWNIPLTRPTGLRAEDQQALGRALAPHLASSRRRQDSQPAMMRLNHRTPSPPTADSHEYQRPQQRHRRKRDWQRTNDCVA